MLPEALHLYYACLLGSTHIIKYIKETWKISSKSPFLRDNFGRCLGSAEVSITFLVCQI